MVIINFKCRLAELWPYRWNPSTNFIFSSSKATSSPSSPKPPPKSPSSSSRSQPIKFTVSSRNFSSPLTPIATLHLSMDLLAPSAVIPSLPPIPTCITIPYLPPLNSPSPIKTIDLSTEVSRKNQMRRRMGPANWDSGGPWRAPTLINV